MGDRAQIAVKMAEGKVYLYSHWGGADIFKVLQKALKAGKRLDDEEYFTRILFREMGAAESGETGYGIGLAPHGDVEHAIPVVDCDTQDITWDSDKPDGAKECYSFSEFAALPSNFSNW